MLKMLKVVESISEKIEIDEYIPLKVYWVYNETPDEDITYFRTGDLKNSILEFGVYNLTGRLRSVTLISAGTIHNTLLQSLSRVPPKIGTPIIQMDHLNGVRKVDNIGAFDLYHNNNAIQLLISKNKITDTIISGRVVFGFDNNSDICAVSVIDLSDKEYSVMKETLDWNSLQKKGISNG